MSRDSSKDGPETKADVAVVGSSPSSGPSVEDDFKPPQQQLPRKRPVATAAASASYSGGTRGVSGRVIPTTVPSTTDKSIDRTGPQEADTDSKRIGGVQGALADVNRGPEEEATAFQPPKTVIRSPPASAGEGHQAKPGRSDSSSISSVTSDEHTLPDHDKHHSRQYAARQRSKHSARNQYPGSGGYYPYPHHYPYYAYPVHPHVPPPPMYGVSPPLEPTPLGSIRDAIDGEAPTSPMRDLLDFDPTFVEDSPERPTPPAPPGSRKQQTQQEKRQQEKRQQASSKSSSKSPHRRRQAGAAAGAMPMHPPFEAFGYPPPGMPHPHMGIMPFEGPSSSQKQHQFAVPYPYHHQGYPPPAHHLYGGVPPPSPHGRNPPRNPADYPWHMHYQQQYEQNRKSASGTEAGRGRERSRGVPPKNASSTGTSKRSDSAIALGGTEVGTNAGTPPVKKQQSKPGTVRASSSHSLTGYSSPYRSPIKSRTSSRTPLMSPLMPRTPTGSAYYSTFPTPGNPTDLEFGDVFNLQSTNSFGFDLAESNGNTRIGESPWPSSYGRGSVQGSHPGQRSHEAASGEFSPFSKVLSTLSPVPGCIPAHPSPLPLEGSPTSTERRSLPARAKSQERPTLEPVPTLSKRSSKQPEALAAPPEKKPSHGPYRLQIGGDITPKSDVKQGIKGINAALRSSPSRQVITPSVQKVRYPFEHGNDYPSRSQPQGPPRPQGQPQPPTQHAYASHYQTPVRPRSQSLAPYSSAAPTPSHSVLNSAGRKRTSSASRKPTSSARTPRQTPPSASRSGKGKKTPVKAQGPPKCNCKKSKCLKLYCDCFAQQRYCNDCNCNDCKNTAEFEDVRKKAIRETKNKNPSAFKSKFTDTKTNAKHSTGCKCKKSRCLKKYCECFEGGVFCALNCKCNDCQNFEGSQALIDRKNKIKDRRGGQTVMAASDSRWRGSGKHPVTVTPSTLVSSRSRPSPANSYASGTPSSIPGSVIPMAKNMPLHPPPPPPHFMPPPHMHMPYSDPNQRIRHPGMAYSPPSMQTPTQGHDVAAARMAAANATRMSNSNRKRQAATKSSVSGSRKTPKTFSTSSASRMSAMNERKRTVTPRTPKTRLTFDPHSSKKKVPPGQLEPTDKYFGPERMPVPKTAALATFSFLSNEDLFLASLVSKQWNDLAKDEEMWDLEV